MEVNMLRNPRFALLGTVGIALAMATGAAQSAPVDLSSWLTDGSGNWTLQTTSVPNDSVNQSLNSRPTVFFNDVDSQGLALSGTIKQGPGGGDNDFFGFVLGYDDEDLFGTNATTDYILVDWKQDDQAGWGEGLAISRVVGSIDTCGTCTASNAWQHNGNVQFIQRAATLGATGWIDDTEYLFNISFTSTNITVSVDGVEQFNLNGTFENGSFGFYNFSQPNVNYAGIEEEELPPMCGDPGQPPCSSVPEPTTLLLLGLGLAGLGFARKRLH
jgi:hypothetical protein